MTNGCHVDTISDPSDAIMIVYIESYSHSQIRKLTQSVFFLWLILHSSMKKVQMCTLGPYISALCIDSYFVKKKKLDFVAFFYAYEFAQKLNKKVNYVSAKSPPCTPNL